MLKRNDKVNDHGTEVIIPVGIDWDYADHLEAIKTMKIIKTWKDGSGSEEVTDIDKMVSRIQNCYDIDKADILMSLATGITIQTMSAYYDVLK